MGKIKTRNIGGNTFNVGGVHLRMVRGNSVSSNIQPMSRMQRLKGWAMLGAIGLAMTAASLAGQWVVCRIFGW
jgi:hypothetical protein